MDLRLVGGLFEKVERLHKSFVKLIGCSSDLELVVEIL